MEVILLGACQVGERMIVYGLSVGHPDYKKMLAKMSEHRDARPQLFRDELRTPEECRAWRLAGGMTDEQFAASCERMTRTRL